MSQQQPNPGDRWKSPALLTALIVDVHQFSAMCDDPRAEEMARFMSDVLVGATMITEQENGLVANTMGDAVLALFDDVERAFVAAMKIVKDFGDQHEHLLRHHESDANSSPEPYVELGLRCRCAIELGPIEHRTITTANSGTFTLWVGSSINYAARILHLQEDANTSGEPVFNTIIVGPRAYEVLGTRYSGFMAPITLPVKGSVFTGYPFETVDLYDE